MSDALRDAAQAVLDRWDSPQWQWTKHGPTADLMHALRAALSQQAGWRLVPVEPTPEIREAICAAAAEADWPNAYGEAAQQRRRQRAYRVWADALAAAAPQPGAQDG